MTSNEYRANCFARREPSNLLHRELKVGLDRA
jgi:hypothetical protein